MLEEAGSHRIIERSLAYSPRARKPYQCRRCGRLFRTRSRALKHQCHGELSSGWVSWQGLRGWMPSARLVSSDSNSPQTKEASQDE